MTGSSEDGKAPASEKLLPCDVVMAGGVTSGVIYPGAVAAIARRFSFHSIGGASVGAIAAAVTAAAEYGRRTGARTDAFDLIAQMPSSLGEPAPDKRSRLFHLFTPETGTKPLMHLVAPVFSRGGLGAFAAGALRAALASWPIVAALVAAVAISFSLVVAVLREGNMLLLPGALLAALAFVLVVWAGMLALAFRWSWAPAWRANGYGICTGNARTKDAGFESLTPWVHRTVQHMAGRGVADDPLTFGDLWRAPASPTEHGRAIELEMTASDLSRNRNVQIPFMEAPTPLYVEEKMLTRYFPQEIARWMRDHAGEYDERVERRPGVYRLPSPEALPVVFGARLSLSFPLLLSAVPLLTPDFARARHDSSIPLRRIWLSDGGLTSNFPVHFFDSPIPSRPTFCLNLIDYEAEAPDDATDESGEARDGARKPIAKARDASRRAASMAALDAEGDPAPGDPIWGYVSMIRGNRVAHAPFTNIDGAEGAGVTAFLQAALNTARFWSDNQLVSAPGVRDRVVDIALAENEGGLNLDMSATTIRVLARRGRAAGMLISARFDPRAQTDPETGSANEHAFPNHRWVRYRNFMAAVEDVSLRFAVSRARSDAAARRRDETQLNDMIAGNATEKIGYYPLPRAARPFYRTYTDRLDDLARDMAHEARENPQANFDAGAPRPKMRLRLRPVPGNDPEAEHAEMP